MTDLYFIPECFVDTNLVLTLLNIFGQGSGGVNHQHSCNNVANTMKNKFTDKFAVGIIDDDKKKTSYIDEFIEIGSSEHLTLLKHKSRDHFIVLVKKAAEDFILSCVNAMNEKKQEEIKRKYTFVSDLNTLKGKTKNTKADKDDNLRKLFKDIQNTKEMQILGNILSYMKTHKYDSDIETLKKFFC